MLRKSPRLPTSAPPYIVPGTLGGPTNTTPELPRRRKTIRSARLGPRSSGRTHRFLLQFTKIRYGRDKRTSPERDCGRGGRARASGDGRLTLVGSNRRDIVSRPVVGRYRWSIPQDDFRALAKARRTVSYSPNLMPAMARAHRR